MASPMSLAPMTSSSTAMIAALLRLIQVRRPARISPAAARERVDGDGQPRTERAEDDEDAQCDACSPAGRPAWAIAAPAATTSNRGDVHPHRVRLEPGRAATMSTWPRRRWTAGRGRGQGRRGSAAFCRSSAGCRGTTARGCASTSSPARRSEGCSSRSRSRTPDSQGSNRRPASTHCWPPSSPMPSSGPAGTSWPARPRPPRCCSRRRCPAWATPAPTSTLRTRRSWWCSTLDVLPGLVIGVLSMLLLFVFTSSRPHVAVLGRVPGVPGAFGAIERHPDY
jgi:hypothetical protein